MWKKYGPYVLPVFFYAAILAGITLVGVFIYEAITGILGGNGLFVMSRFLWTASDALFLEGSVILTLGALMEFFFKDVSSMVARGMTSPVDGFMHNINRGEGGESRSGGWMLVFLGALLALASLALAFAAVG
jgi:hypothetical protein